jgi:hypothetical protein
MPPKNPKAATPAEVGPQEIRRVGDKKGIAKIRREVRKQREKAVFTKILQEVAQETAVAEICRQLGKRKREKGGLHEILARDGTRRYYRREDQPGME